MLRSFFLMSKSDLLRSSAGRTRNRKIRHVEMTEALMLTQRFFHITSKMTAGNLAAKQIDIVIAIAAVFARLTTTKMN